MGNAHVGDSCWCVIRFYDWCESCVDLLDDFVRVRGC